MLDHTAASIKSLEGFRIAWIDEAETLSARSLSLLRPTIRAERSELWASWNPYNVPLAAGMDYWAPTAPNSSFAFPIGQAISRTTYAALFALTGTTYGAGDGSTTFNLPDKRGRVSAAADPTGGVLTSFSMSPNGNTLGAIGGTQVSQLSTANLPPYTPGGSVSGTVGGTATASALSVKWGNQQCRLLSIWRFATHSPFGVVLGKLRWRGTGRNQRAIHQHATFDYLQLHHASHLARKAFWTI
jgi:microcystin-dependent protein